MEQHACATLAISVSPTRPLRRRSSHVRGDHTRAPGGRGWVRRPCSRCNPRARLHTPSLSFGVYSLPCFCWLSCSVLRSSLRPSSSATCPPHRTIFRHPAPAGWPVEGLCRVPGSRQDRSEKTNTALCAHTTRARARKTAPATCARREATRRRGATVRRTRSRRSCRATFKLGPVSAAMLVGCPDAAAGRLGRGGPRVRRAARQAQGRAGHDACAAAGAPILDSPAAACRGYSTCTAPRDSLLYCIRGEPTFGASAGHGMSRAGPIGAAQFVLPAHRERACAR